MRRKPIQEDESHHRLCRDDNTHDCYQRRRYQLFGLGQRTRMGEPQRKLRVTCRVQVVPASQNREARSATRCQATLFPQPLVTFAKPCLHCNMEGALGMLERLK